jgi:hypothetical protein
MVGDQYRSWRTITPSKSHNCLDATQLSVRSDRTAARRKQYLDQLSLRREARECAPVGPQYDEIGTLIMGLRHEAREC